MNNINLLSKKSILVALLASPLFLGATIAQADEAAPAVAAAAEAAPAYTLAYNITAVTDYYARGVSQSWKRGALQAGVDFAHSSGFYAGAWASTISDNTYVGAHNEIDIYGGYNGTITAVEGLGWTVGGIGYFYPRGGWDKYDPLTTVSGVVNEDFTTYEANVGVSYKWLSAKASFTLGEWYGANRDTGWTEDSSGSTYLELNANVPLPVWGLTLVGHVGRLNVKGELSREPAFANPNGTTIVETNADMTDYKLGLTKSFSVSSAVGVNVGLYYVGGTNGGTTGYWGTSGYGGSSFTTPSQGAKDLTEDKAILSVGVTF